MGDFKLEIHAFGDHGIDRDKKDGEVIDYTPKDGWTLGSTDRLCKEFVDFLKTKGVDVKLATITHWPQEYYNREKSGPVDDLLTGIRSGNF